MFKFLNFGLKLNFIHVFEHQEKQKKIAKKARKTQVIFSSIFKGVSV